MPEAKTTNRAASADNSAGAVARSEKNGKPKHHKWRGLDLTLPPEVPMALIYSFWDLQEAEQSGNDQDALFGALNMLKGLVGQEQMRKIRNKQIADRVDAGKGSEDLMKLLGVMLKKYGIGPGESKASARS